ncbi:hypothetical protein XI09_08890 [Bradyrhizobium sp. CCBAU 11386]|nr:hypothetical protein [Bradyrhizobium sp. CCBAU 11386]
MLPAFGRASQGKVGGVTLQAGQQGEISLKALAPFQVDRLRRLMTAAILIGGVSQGPICEALVSTY